jgi:hypothetical protein
LQQGAAALLLLAATGVASAQPLTISCPMRVQSLGAQLQDDAGIGFGVAFHSSSLAYLTGVSMFEGQPREGAELEPTGLDGKLHWDLQGIGQVAVLLCRYEGGIALGRTLRPGMRQCTAAVVASRTDGRTVTLPERTVIACE